MRRDLGQKRAIWGKNCGEKREFGGKWGLGENKEGIGGKKGQFGAKI